MPSRFDVNNKPLNKAKPCITLLLRDDGSTEWYEGCKAGQLLEIKSGGQKSYLNLDYNKVMNFNVGTEEKEFLNVSEHLKKVYDQRVEFQKKQKLEEDKLNQDLSKLETLQESTTDLVKKAKIEQDIIKRKSLYDSKINGLIGKYVKLSKNKMKNFGSDSKPILGFVCYEKEFNALPYKAEHDSKAITQWMDDILKNKKDFQAQRTEAIGKVLLWVLLGLGVLAFIFFRWGAPLLEKTDTVTAPVGNVGVIPIFIPIFYQGLSKWLKKRNLRKLREK